MALLTDSAKDAALNYVKNNATELHILSQEPVNYSDVSTYTLGNGGTLSFTGPQDHSTDGREVIIDAISNGSVTGTGTASHWCVTDGVGELIATEALSSSQSVTSGNAFTLDAISIRIPDVV